MQKIFEVRVSWQVLFELYFSTHVNSSLERMFALKYGFGCGFICPPSLFHNMVRPLLTPVATLYMSADTCSEGICVRSSCMVYLTTVFGKEFVQGWGWRLNLGLINQVMHTPSISRALIYHISMNVHVSMHVQSTHKSFICWTDEVPWGSLSRPQYFSWSNMKWKGYVMRT